MGLFDWVINKFTKASRATSLITATSGRHAKWSEHDYEKFAKETYLKNVIAYRCIVEISQSVGAVPWGAFKELSNGQRELYPDHYTADLLKRANPNESFGYLMSKVAAYHVMAGNSFIEKITPKTGPNTKIPQELYSLRPDRMSILPGVGNKLVAGYEYTVNGQSQTWYNNVLTGRGNILHLKSFHPTNDWYGASVTEAAAREIDTSNEMVEWNKKLLENEARPGLVLTVIGGLSDKSFERLEKQLKEDHSGAQNAGNNLILEGNQGTKAEPYGWSPGDLDYIEGGREIARRICHAYRVPPQVIGIPGESKYKNYEEARLHFWEDTICSYLNFYRNELNAWLIEDERDKDVFIDYVLDDIPALVPRREIPWKRAQESDFLTINEKRELVGMEATDGGDVVLVPASMIPLDLAGQEIENEVMSDEGEDEEDDVRKKLRKEGYTEEEIDEMMKEEDGAKKKRTDKDSEDESKK